MKLESIAFKEGQAIPDLFTCVGADRSPPLTWEDVPDGTSSFALIADDPDAPRGTWVHWVIYNIPGDVTELEQDITDDESLDDGSLQGENDFHRVGYGGPCPPPGHGRHRYFFKLYALDAALELEPGATKGELLEAMEGHVLAETQLMGTYER